ncbi:MAG TPA: glucosamine-6-phosphate deaminase [Mycobacteriales bacterium]|nr:glucosamine-6-phosphate deaminase [Mycobacteriales bacterium]
MSSLDQVDPTLRDLHVDRLRVRIYSDKAVMGSSAARDVGARLRELLATQETVRMIFAAAPSQDSLLDGLVAEAGIDWSRVEALHMDEYVGLSADSPGSFAAYLNQRIFDKVRPGRAALIDGAADPGRESERYTGELRRGPVDIVCLGIGENGHIAFNDPDVADFADPELVKVVTLDERSRRQQVNDECFERLEDVPTQAITLSIPALTSGRHLFCVVPGATKAEAVERMLTGPISEACPASVLRRHESCGLYLDADSAGELTL